MFGRAGIGGIIIVIAGVVVAGALLARRHAARRDASPFPEVVLPAASATDPFPLDARVRVFETRQHRVGEGILTFEIAARGRETFRDHEYVVFETRVKSKATGEGRLVSREWIRREPGAVLCGRRGEGSEVFDLVPEQAILELPLVPGKKWSWSPEPGRGNSRVTTTVVGRERIAVGAGTFEDAWRIDNEVEDGEERVRRSLWLQDGVGLVEERSSIVLPDRMVELDAALLGVSP